MKKLLILSLLLLSLLGFSQQKELTWHTDINKAINLSAESEKPLLMFFTGSDWCGWCKKLKKAVFDTETFQKWAAENVILFELDYPRRTPQDPRIKEQNQQLQQIFRSVVRGYPTVLIFDIERDYDGGEKKADGIKIHGKMGYMGDPDSFVNVANNHISNRKK